MTNEFCNMIIDKLLNVLGLSVIQDYIYDEDKCGFLTYNEGRMKVNRMGIFHTCDTEFNPIFDVKQIQYLFAVYTSKEAEDNGLYVQSMGINNKFSTSTVTSIGSAPIKYSVHIDTNEGAIDTRYYYNMSLAYIEAIFRLSNIFDWDFNLQEWLKNTDYTDADMLAKLENSKKGRRY